MSKKLTWNKIYEEFKDGYSSIYGDPSYWRPYNFATILIYLKDGQKITYNHDTKKVTTLEERWQK